MNRSPQPNYKHQNRQGIQCKENHVPTLKYLSLRIIMQFIMNKKTWFPWILLEANTDTCLKTIIHECEKLN